MIVAISMSGLKRAKWYEYLIRFTLGGLVTAIAGFIAEKLGPGVGGLFLAFPAILVASSTLIEKHERKRKEQKGLRGLYRGRHAAGVDAAGAAMGSFGLIAFGWFVWKFLPEHSAQLVIALGTLIWAVVSGGLWWIWKQNYLHRMWRAFARN